MKIQLKDSEYLEIKISPKKTSVKISIKTKVDEDSFAIISCDVNREGVDSIISELINFRSELKNEKV